MKLSLDVLKALAPFQSPKLQAVMVQNVDKRPREEHVRITVDIFDDDGTRVQRLVDGAGMSGIFLRVGHAPQRLHCMAGHIGLEPAYPSSRYLIGIE